MVWETLGGILLAIVGGIVYLRIRKRRRHRLISFVGLLREPINFDPAVLAHVAGKAWQADLGDGTSEGANGFVAGAGLLNTIIYDGRMFLINSFPSPYVDQVEKASESIVDLRIRSLFCEHQAWFSCDALGVVGTTSAETVCEWYQRLGKLFAELLDDHSLLIYLPDTGRAYPINEETESALRSPDPITALQETLTVPIIQVSNDDPLMVQAVEKAREGWPTFIAAFEARAGTDFSIKAPITRDENTEFIWVSITSVEGDNVYGVLGNDPHNLGSLKIGSKVSVPIADLNDWCYLDSDGNMAGGFTVKAVQAAARRGRA